MYTNGSLFRELTEEEEVEQKWRLKNDWYFKNN